MTNVEENYNSLLEQIKSAKQKGKKTISVKTFQCEYKKNGVPKNVFALVGIYEGSEAVKKLNELGYNIHFTTTDRQLNVNTGYMKKMKTTNINIYW